MMIEKKNRVYQIYFIIIINVIIIVIVIVIIIIIIIFIIVFIIISLHYHFHFQSPNCDMVRYCERKFLTHWGRVMHIRVARPDHYCFR